MNDSKIAVRYAKAVFLLAEEKSLLQTVAEDMERLLSVQKEVPELSDLFQTPILSSNQKKDTFSKAFKGQFSDITERFINLIIDNKRESHISGVARNFLKRYYRHLGIKNARLTTAVPIDENCQAEITKMIKQVYQSEIKMETAVNPDLIGGLVLKIEDNQYDASIATQLKNIKQELLQ